MDFKKRLFCPTWKLLKSALFWTQWDFCSFCRNVLPYYISKGHTNITPDLGHFIFRSEKYEFFSQNFVNILKNFVNILCFFGSILDLTLVCKENFRLVRLLSVYDNPDCRSIVQILFLSQIFIRVNIRVNNMLYQIFSRCSKNILYIHKFISYK